MTPVMTDNTRRLSTEMRREIFSRITHGEFPTHADTYGALHDLDEADIEIKTQARRLPDFWQAILPGVAFPGDNDAIMYLRAKLADGERRGLDQARAMLTDRDETIHCLRESVAELRDALGEVRSTWLSLSPDDWARWIDAAAQPGEAVSRPRF